MWTLRILKESTKVSTIGGSFFRLYRVMRRFFKTFPCTIGWHKRPEKIDLVGGGRFNAAKPLLWDSFKNLLW